MTPPHPLHLTVRRGPHVGQTFVVDGPVVTLGRTDGNDIVIQAATMSRRHARITRDDGHHLIEDLGSSNGTFVNNQRVEAPREIREGDVVRFGDGIELAIVPAGAPSGVRAATVIADLPVEGQPPPVAPTLLADDLAAAALAPQLLVQSSGSSASPFELHAQVVRLGRAPENEICLEAAYVSRYQAELIRTEAGYRLQPNPDALNPLILRGRPFLEPVDLTHGDVFRLAGPGPGEMTTFTYFDWARADESAAPPQALRVEPGGRVRIGRAPDNDIVLDDPLVSRYHAELDRVGGRFRLRDLKSANGVFVNGARLAGTAWLAPQDEVRVGRLRLSVSEESLHPREDSGGTLMEVRHLNKWVRPDLNLLQDLSFCMHPCEFVVLVGLSGAGKSTLMDALAGYRPATHGEVSVNGVNLYRHFDAVRDRIGYVPQRDIIHMELTVFQALDYAAQLRMPADTTVEERHRRVGEVLADLGLAERRDVSVSALSGGQQKRVSIGVELITRPGLFFLDEPTSGLDPGTETLLMQLMRSLADQGRTIILITHATKNVMLADKVIFLVRGGRLAWYGPPEEALTHFDQYRSERERRAEDIEFDKIYAILEDPSRGTPQGWEQRFRASPAYEKYVAGPLGLDGGAPQATAAPTSPSIPAPAPAAAPRPKPVSALRQLLVLSSRNLQILVRDRFSLVLMLLAAPLLGLMDFLIVERRMFDALDGNAEKIAVTLFTQCITAIFVGALAQMREIVKETAIYKRERLVNLKILPYVLSKVWMAALLALYQALAYLVIRYLAVDMPGGLAEAFGIYVTLVLATLAGMMLGLFVSALSPTQAAAPLLTILFLIPQILLGGGLLPVRSLGPVGGAVSALVSSRWAFEALVSQSGYGRDVARDACWQLPESEREALTDEYKRENCSCMGGGIFQNCNFPGVTAFYDSAVDRTEPAQPAQPEAPGDPPPQPEFPPEPTMPPTPEVPAEPESTVFADLVLPDPPSPPEQPYEYTPFNQLQYNLAVGEYLEALEAHTQLSQSLTEQHFRDYKQAVDEYFDALQAYQAEVEASQTGYSDQVKSIQEAYNDEVQALRDGYTLELEAYQAKVDDAKAAQERYEAAMEAYQDDYGEWQGGRSGAVAGVEGMLETFYDKFGALYDVNVPSRWLAQAAIIAALFGLTLYLQKRKDVI